jgi:hypothetical protein
MTETWLQANRRAFLLPIGAAIAIEAVALILFGLRFLGSEPLVKPTESLWFWVLLSIAFAAFVIGSLLFFIARVPRILYADGRVKFFVRFGPPVEVPVEHVEAFLLGRGPIFFSDDRRETKETTTLLVRIAERAHDYHNVTTAPLLAAWCGNQATIRGTWTEPLGLELVNRLNQRLYDVKQVRAAANASGAGT